MYNEIPTLMQITGKQKLRICQQSWSEPLSATSYSLALFQCLCPFIIQYMRTSPTLNLSKICRNAQMRHSGGWSAVWEEELKRQISRPLLGTRQKVSNVLHLPKSQALLPQDLSTIVQSSHKPTQIEGFCIHIFVDMFSFPLARSLGLGLLVLWFGS
jgi:hypothetical protein